MYTTYVSHIVWDNGVVNSFASVSLEEVIINWAGSDVTQRKANFISWNTLIKMFFLTQNWYVGQSPTLILACVTQ